MYCMGVFSQYYSVSPETVRLRQLASTSPRYDLAEHCSSLSPWTSEESAPGVEEGETGLPQPGYNEVMLDWVQEWDKNTQDLIKLDVLLYKHGKLPYLFFLQHCVLLYHYINFALKIVVI